MGKRKYPPLKHKEVLEIISNLGFQYKRTVGSHAHYERLERNTRYIVTVANYSEFDDYLIKSMIDQAGCSREAFYSACPSAKKKIR